MSRKTAVNILERVLNERAYSNIILSNELNASDLSDKDKALVTELVYGTLRRLKSLDMIIAHFVKDISVMDKKTLNILRVAVYQMQYLDKIPNYEGYQVSNNGKVRTHKKLHLQINMEKDIGKTEY